MNEKELTVCFKTQENRSGGANQLRVLFLIGKQDVLSEEEILPLYLDYQEDFEQGDFLFANFDELKNFILYLCRRFGKNSYKLLSINQFNEEQKSFNHAEQYLDYFRNLKTFPTEAKKPGRKGSLFDRFF